MASVVSSSVPSICSQRYNTFMFVTDNWKFVSCELYNASQMSIKLEHAEFT
jgi:hypothetical protein